MDQTLNNIKKKVETVAGDWNGEDLTFISGGRTFTEEQAQVATETVDLIKRLETNLFILGY